MIVYKLTATKKNLLLGKEYTKDMKFNPQQDANNYWFISEEEVNQCDVAEFAWVKDLPTMEYNPKVIDFPL